jgi:hypothetical protein
MRTSKTSASKRGRRSFRLFPILGYAVAQVFVLYAFVTAALDWPGIAMRSDLPLFLTLAGQSFFSVLLFAAPPLLMIGVVYGLVRLVRHAAWSLAGRVVVSVLVAALGVWVAVVGYLTIWFHGDIPIMAWGAIDAKPIPLGVYAGVLAGMEAALALTWVVAFTVVQTYQAAREYMRGPTPVASGPRPERGR